MARSTRASVAATAAGSRGTTTSAGDAGRVVVGGGATGVDPGPTTSVCGAARRADWRGEGSDEHATPWITAASASARTPDTILRRLFPDGDDAVMAAGAIGADLRLELGPHVGDMVGSFKVNALRRRARQR